MKIRWLIAIEGELSHLQYFNTNNNNNTEWSAYTRVSDLRLEPSNNELLIPGRSARTEVDLLISLGYTDEQLWNHYSEYRNSVVGITRPR